MRPEQEPAYLNAAALELERVGDELCAMATDVSGQYERAEWESPGAERARAEALASARRLNGYANDCRLAALELRVRARAAAAAAEFAEPAETVRALR